MKLPVSIVKSASLDCFFTLRQTHRLRISCVKAISNITHCTTLIKVGHKKRKHIIWTRDFCGLACPRTFEYGATGRAKSFCDYRLNTQTNQNCNGGSAPYHKLASPFYTRAIATSLIIELDYCILSFCTMVSLCVVF